MNRQALRESFLAVRRTTEELCAPLETEDYVVQPVEDVSPPKWHLGHTTWFFEQVILEDFVTGYRTFSPDYYYVFNSYYETFGQRTLRVHRGNLSRPTVKQVEEYRLAIDERMLELIDTVDDSRLDDLASLVALGINHEQQHQELLLTDIKFIMAANPLRPAYLPANDTSSSNTSPGPARFVEFAGGIQEFGAAGGNGFVYDNETPRHSALIADFRLMDRLVTCGEYLEFINDGGYRNVDLWLSDGWDTVRSQEWQAPLYWERKDDQWLVMTLFGPRPLNQDEPVCHVSFYEAAAYARWARKRLPTEYEWELAAATVSGETENGNFQDDRRFHPMPAAAGDGLRQMHGDLWELTGSAYLAYPGYMRAQGYLGEYNGKFMNNQMVLRGGSCATPRNHYRNTYRNFFQGDKRWQFQGFRLAEDAN